VNPTPPPETETEILRRETTPRMLYWTRWLNGVGIPSLIALQSGVHIIATKYGWDMTWFDTLVMTFIAYNTAQGGWMDGIWKRRQDEKKANGTTK
jgi:hypothetical protein